MGRMFLKAGKERRPEGVSFFGYRLSKLPWPLVPSRGALPGFLIDSAVATGGLKSLLPSGKADLLVKTGVRRNEHEPTGRVRELFGARPADDAGEIVPLPWRPL